MTCAGRSRSRSLARPVSARTRRTRSSGKVLAITPRLTWSLRRTPAGRPAGERAIAVARPRASASMAQLCPYVNRIVVNGGLALPASRGLGERRPAAGPGQLACRSGQRRRQLAQRLLDGVEARVRDVGGLVHKQAAAQLELEGVDARLGPAVPPGDVAAGIRSVARHREPGAA